MSEQNNSQEPKKRGRKPLPEPKDRTRSSYEIDTNLKDGFDAFVKLTCPLSKLLALAAAAPEEYAEALRPLLQRDLAKKAPKVDKTADRLLKTMAPDEIAALVVRLQGQS